jgi:hypothetical protein
MSQVTAPVFKIPTKSPQLASGKARAPGGRAKKAAPVTVYPARSADGRWRAVWHEDGQRRQSEAATEEGLAAKLEKLQMHLEADAPNMTKPGAARPDRPLPGPRPAACHGAVAAQARPHPGAAV